MKSLCVVRESGLRVTSSRGEVAKALERIAREYQGLGNNYELEPHVCD